MSYLLQDAFVGTNVVNVQGGVESLEAAALAAGLQSQSAPGASPAADGL